jgi:hypothetical protein
MSEGGRGAASEQDINNSRREWMKGVTSRSTKRTSPPADVTMFSISLPLPLGMTDSVKWMRYPFRIESRRAPKKMKERQELKKCDRIDRKQDAQHTLERLAKRKVKRFLAFRIVQSKLFIVCVTTSTNNLIDKETKQEKKETDPRTCRSPCICQAK